MRPHVFVTRQLPAPAMKRLAEVCEYQIGVEQGALDREALLAGVRDANGLVSLLTDSIDSEVIRAGARLRVIANVAVGFNNIDVLTARERSVYVTNTPDVLTEATANLTWALILATTRRIVEADAFTRAGKFTGWDFDMLLGSGITGKTLGVVGYGRTMRRSRFQPQAWPSRFWFREWRCRCGGVTRRCSSRVAGRRSPVRFRKHPGLLRQYAVAARPRSKRIRQLRGRARC